VIYPIETNYRSTPQILEVANAAIASNKHQFEKKLAPVRPGGAKPAVVSCLDGAQQAKFVVQRVLELREQDIPLDRMAVLYRSHFQALELQLELTRRRIPFTITSGIRFFEQAHIKDATAYLKLVSNLAGRWSPSRGWCGCCRESVPGRRNGFGQPSKQRRQAPPGRRTWPRGSRPAPARFPNGQRRTGPS
jgi:superfamily I DNA/RNA helicase